MVNTISDWTRKLILLLINKVTTAAAADPADPLRHRLLWERDRGLFHVLKLHPLCASLLRCLWGVSALQEQFL